jgi:hypothetical protein
MRKTISRYLATMEAGLQQKTNPSIMRVLLSEEHIRVDFGYAAPWIYTRGGWIRISPHTYLRVQGKEKRYKLIEAKNIAIAPSQHHFESTQDWCVFSLIFEPIPIKDCQVDIIEEENPTPNDFNYYGIRLTCVKDKELLWSIERG